MTKYDTRCVAVVMGNLFISSIAFKAIIVKFGIISFVMENFFLSILPDPCMFFVYEEIHFAVMSKLSISSVAFKTTTIAFQTIV